MMFVGPTVFNITKMRFNRPGGILFPFPTLHVRPDRAAFVRAFMESVGYTLRANLEQLTAVTGREPADFTLSGGMTRSGVLTGIVADVIGLPVGVAEEAESAALGCAILIAANDNRDGLIGATRAMVRHKHIKPDADTHERYVVPYAKWRELYDALDELELA
jgi:autoinducer 2 (AI-2) kinase